VGGVAAARLVLIAALLQLLPRVLPDGLEHPVTGALLATVVGGHRHQRLLDQGPEVIYHRFGVAVAGLRAHRLGRRKREAPDEHGEAPEQPPLRLGEQVVAPVEGGAHGLLTLGEVSCPTGRQRLVEP
jgi:hypothetical protein